MLGLNKPDNVISIPEQQKIVNIIKNTIFAPRSMIEFVCSSATPMEIDSLRLRVNESRRELRHQNILVERTYRNDYSYHQPTACMIRLINQYSDCFLKAQSKNEFKNLICKHRCDFIETDIGCN